MTEKPEGSRSSVQQAEYGQGADFPYAPESVGEARRILGGDLRQLAVAQNAADDAVLILSELVSNALRHARPLNGGTIRVAWWTSDRRLLRIAVTDGGGVGEVADATELRGLDEVDESAVDGRGLGIIGALAEEWGVEPTEADDPTAPKTVWAAVRIHSRHAAPRPPDKPRKDRLRHLRFVRRVRNSLRSPGVVSVDDGATGVSAVSVLRLLRLTWLPRARLVDTPLM